MKNRITRAVSNYNLGFRFLINKIKEKIHISSYVCSFANGLTCF